MSEIIRITHHPVFQKGTFHEHPDLFGRFEQNSPDHLQEKYERLWRAMPRYEETITWALLEGPGFWGATHPGADTVFVDIMVGINSYVYNSDCLYVNPAQRVYAVSDPPGITTGSRRLFERLDRHLKSSTQAIEALVNRLNKETRPDEGATLSLLHLPENHPGLAQVVIAGDSFVLHGNTETHTITTVTGKHDFIGTPYAEFTAQELTIRRGDFFLIASDGILSLAHNHPTRNLENALNQHLNGNLDNFVVDVMNASNSYYRETIYDRVFSRFGGNDNISLLLVVPEAVGAHPDADSVILGGYIQERD
ncbi:MAG: PP2C family serine/threonine-protein phosphatase [Dehalococcoidia bacterium]|nr:PP2C family serine/threonine-protein phosphatase [Dehalococcoidia bacterium]